MPRRGATNLSGILAIDKPRGMTSHDVVSAIRRITGERRVGHAGTLDPMATGVLVVLVGPATRLAPFLTSADKAYDARVLFGTETDTDDAEGSVTNTLPVPESLATEAGAIAHVADLVGTHEQIPPAYSALKRDGVTAYRAARSGEPLELNARWIQIFDATLLGVEPGPPIAWNLTLRVSKGTYIRAIARDLGRELDTAAHLAGLRRTESGPITLNQAIPLERLEEITDRSIEKIEPLFLPAQKALEFQTLSIDDDTSAAVAVGKKLSADDLGIPDLPDGTVTLVHNARVIAVYSNTAGTLSPSVVFPGGVA